jgi:hypothetical protein
MYNGTCLDFDGTDDTVSFGYSSDYIMNGPCTIVVIFTGDGNLTGSTDWRDTLFSNDQSSSFGLEIGAFSGCGIGDTDGFRFLIHRQGNCFSAVSEANAYTRYAVTFFAYTRDSSNAEKMYVDGQEISMQQDNAYTFSAGSSTSYIGTRGTNLGQDLDGQVHDLKIFSKELSAANIKELYDDSKVIIPTKNDASGGFVSQTDLKLWVPLSEGAGSVAYDGSGKGRDGTIANASWLTGQTGAPQLVEGYNRKLLFDGNDYVNCGSDTSLNFTTGNFSVSYWVYVHDITDVGYIVRRGTWGLDGWYTYLESSGRISIYTNDDGQGDPHTSTVSNTSVITENTWHHVVVVRNGATGIIYVDGTNETASGDSMIDPKSTGATCYIGSNTNYIKGIVDEVIVYDTVVTSSQAAALHATDANGGPLPPDPMSGASGLPSSSNVVSYWRNEGTATWTDRGNNSNDGSVVGTSSTLLFKQGINGSKNVNTGRDNQGFPLKQKNVGAIGFNGSTDYTKVLAQSVPELDDIFDGGGTASAWIYAASDGETSYGRILHKRSAGLGWFIECRDESGGFIRIRFQQEFNTTDGQWQTAVDVPINQWVYVCVTYDSDSVSNDATIYINGVSSSSEAQTPVGTRGTDDAQHLYIGNRGANDYTFDGQIANAQLYNRALTYAEIQQNYNSFKARFGK